MNQEPVFKNFCAPRANNVTGARFGRKNRGRSRSCASSRARQGQERPKHAGLELTILRTWSERRARALCGSRIRATADMCCLPCEGVQATTGKTISSQQLGPALSEMQRRPTLDASTGPCKPLSWQAAVLYRFKATAGRVPPARA